MSDQFTIIKQQISADPSRKLSVSWTSESFDVLSAHSYSSWEPFTSPYSVSTLSGDRIYGECYRRKVSIPFGNGWMNEYEYATIFDIISGKYEVREPTGNIEKQIAVAVAAEIDKETLENLTISDFILNEEWLEEVKSFEPVKIEIENSLILPNESWIISDNNA